MKRPQNSASARRPRAPAGERVSQSSDVASFADNRPTASAQCKVADAIDRSPQATAQRRLSAAIQSRTAGTARSPVAQRTIWRYAEQKWQVAEPGTAGGYQKPAQPDDQEYFNDVNGKRDKNIDAVRAGLADRLLQTGSVDDLGQEGVIGGWEALAAKLEALCQNEHSETVKDSQGLLTLGILKLRRDADGNVTGADVEQQDVTVLDEVKAFLLAFMRANGQLPYIERQAWFKAKKSEADDAEFANDVYIDINFYFDRPMDASGELGFHKDTAGDNLFVNIIFNNAETTPATEWTQDRAAPVGDKEALMDRLMPPGMASDIKALKAALRGDTLRVGGQDRIEGDVLPAHGYVSWVDEAVWHSTPTLAYRPGYGDLPAYVTGKEAEWDSDVHVYEAALLLTQQPSSRLHAFCDQNAEWIASSVFTHAVWQRMVAFMKQQEGKWLRDDFLADVQKFDFSKLKASGRSAEETDSDFRNLAAKSRVPTGVARRTRSNSDPEVLKRVRGAAEKQSRRSFLRTWIRAGPKQ